MRSLFQFSQASTESASGSASAETLVKILHVVAIPKSVEIWQSAAVEYEKDHPEVKIQFDYLENEEFKAELPTLLESDDRPSVFFSWGGGIMLEQIMAGVCQDITNAVAGTSRIRSIQPVFRLSCLRVNRTGYLTALVQRFFGIISSYAGKQELIQTGSNIGRIYSMRSKSAKRRALLLWPLVDPKNGPSSSILHF